MTRTRNSIASALLAISTMASAGATLAAEPLHIVAIGDSITAGGRAGTKEYTYRLPLLRMLRDENACFDFVGARRGGLDPAAYWPGGTDSENEGYYGARTAEVRDRLAADLPKFEAPDLALIHLGTNDSRGFVEDDIIAPLVDIIGMLRARNPHVAVMVAQIKAAKGFRTTYMHLRIMQLAAELSSAESPVTAVDQYSGFNPASDTFDGVHPNLIGQRKMAERWLQAMRPFLRIDPQNC